MSATSALAEVVAGEVNLGLWGEQLEQEPTELAWLWQGFLAPGNVTLLTSR